MDYQKMSDILKSVDIKRLEKPLNKRQEIIKMFVDRLNSDRVLSGRKELPASFYAMKMYDAGLKTDFLLWWFWGYCKDAKNFSSCWWWNLNSKK